MSSTPAPQPGRPREPSQIAIAPGLSTILTRRQIGILPAFRAAMLEDASRQVALRGANWLGRDVDDFGVMLTEMFAYVCDVLAFYDGLIAGESYLRTAQRLSDVRKLTGLIGYLPRPAIASLVDLALALEGRLPVHVPAGTAFRSASFAGPSGDEKPQVFTALEGGSFHPLRSRFTLRPQPNTTLPGAIGSTLLTQSLTCERGSVTLKAGDPALVRAGSSYAAALVDSVTNAEDAAGNPITRVSFKDSLELNGGTALSNSALQRPVGTAFVNLYYVLHSPNLSPPGYYYRGVYLDALYRSIKTGDVVLLRKGDHVRWFTVEKAESYDWTVQSSKTITTKVDGKTSTTTIPAVTTPVTRLTFVQEWNGNAQRAPQDTEYWNWTHTGDMTCYFGMSAAGKLAGEATAKIGPNDPIKVREKVEAVAPEAEPERFVLRDLDENAVSVDGALAANGTLTVSNADDWNADLTPPVTVYGAILRATRGERVGNELLGVGDGSMPNQTFKLKKKPLTYLSAPDADSGVQSTLEIYVDGVKWREVPRFYGRKPDERIYIIRQDDKGESWVTFGDGVRGMRLASGARVVGSYYFGAGKAAPPARTVTQMVTPVKGVTSLINPLAAFGGADAEDEANIKSYAPRSALMLGRAVSLVDYEAAAAATTGVRSARAEWRWSGAQQRPVVKIWYIGAGDLGSLIADRLRSISAEGVPFEVEAATAINAALHVSLEIDPDYLADPVIAEVVSTLSTALAPEKLGIGAAIIRSKILALAAGVEGVVAPTGLAINGYPYLSPGYRPPPGVYVEFTQITAGV